MQPQWDGSPPSDAAQALASQSISLLQRMRDVERGLGAQEWWLLGRAIPEALPLSEVASLLAVARGELDTLLAGYFGKRPTLHDLTEPEDEEVDVEALMSDPSWMQARRGEARDLLRMLAGSLPSMQNYATHLRSNAELIALTPAAQDALGIVAERLSDALEALSQPQE